MIAARAGRRRRSGPGRPAEGRGSGEGPPGLPRRACREARTRGGRLGIRATGGYLLPVAVFRTAFVTGASSGIGRQVAARLAAGGTRVVLAARRADLLAEAAAGIRRAGGAADVCPLDVAEPDRVEHAVRDWDERTGGLDLVLANAGVGSTRPAAALSVAEVTALLAVNVTGACATLTAAVGPMVARGRGTLAAVTSLAGVRGMPLSGAYSASKAALSTYLETLRIELEPRGLRVVDVRPGFVETAMTAGNRFPMPFLLELDDAARRAVRALERGRAVAAFPWQLALPLRVAASSPPRVWQRLARRLSGRAGEALEADGGAASRADSDRSGPEPGTR